LTADDGYARDLISLYLHLALDIFYDRSIILLIGWECPDHFGAKIMIDFETCAEMLDNTIGKLAHTLACEGFSVGGVIAIPGWEKFEDEITEMFICEHETGYITCERDMEGFITDTVFDMYYQFHDTLET